LFEAYHRTRFDTQKQMMTVLNESSGASDIVAEKEKFPMINQFGIPFSSSVLQSLVHDIVSIQVGLDHWMLLNVVGLHEN
jgi:hypothetical protein